MVYRAIRKIKEKNSVNIWGLRETGARFDDVFLS